MRFVGTVVYAKRQDHVPDTDEEVGPPTVTDVRLDGKVGGESVWIEIAIPTRLAHAYGIGRRVVVTARPA